MINCLLATNHFQVKDFLTKFSISEINRAFHGLFFFFEFTRLLLELKY